VRVPASYCGIFGFRPDRWPSLKQWSGSLAPSLDTIGWFARDAEALRLVGVILLENPIEPKKSSDS
jgi:amidase